MVNITGTSTKKVFLVANTDWYLYNFRLTLCRMLRDKGYDPVLISPEGEYVQKFKKEGFHWIQWDLRRFTAKPWNEIKPFLQLLKIYTSEKPVIVHHHTIKPVLYGSLIAWITGIKAVINSIAGLGYVFTKLDHRTIILRPIIIILYWCALHLVNGKVIFENIHDYQYFLKKRFTTPRNSIIIRSVGVDTDQFSLQEESTGMPVITMASRMIAGKGVELFVEAARIIHKEDGNFRMVLVGAPDSGHPDSLSEIKLRGWANEKIIEWWGWQNNMVSVYQKSHVVVLPTVYGEGIPKTLIEAGSCGRPVIASDSPGCREVIKHGYNGFLLERNDPNVLAKYILQLGRNPELRKCMGVAGRKLVMEKFMSNYVDHSTYEIYCDMLGLEKPPALESPPLSKLNPDPLKKIIIHQ